MDDDPNNSLHYDPDTGKLYWLVSNNNRVKVGDIAGSIGAYGYLVVRLNGKAYYAHRLAWYLHYGEWPKLSIDHINRDKLDNRIENLRDVSHRDNMMNKENSTGGAHFHASSQRWRSTIWIEGNKKFLGWFKSPEEARFAYQQVIESL